MLLLLLEGGAGVRLARARDRGQRTAIDAIAAQQGPDAPGPAQWDRLRHAELHRYLLDLLTNATFWTTLSVLAVMVVFRVRAGGTPEGLDAAGGALRAVASSRGFLVPFGLATVLASAYAIYMAYEAPRDVMQDITCAQNLLRGEPVYRRDMSFRDPLEAEPARFSLGKWVPPLRGLEREQLYWIEHVQGPPAHPPALTILIAPLVALLGVHGTILALSALSLAALMVTLTLLRHGLGLPARLPSAALAFGVLGWYPVLSILRNGQPGLLLVALLVAGWFFLRRGRPAWAGLTIGLATCLKLYPGLLLLYLLLRHRRALAVALVTIAVMLCLPLPFAGLRIYADYFKTIHSVDTLYERSIGNLSLFGLLAPFHSGHTIAVWLAIGLVSALAYVVSRSPRTIGQLDLEYALMLDSMLLVSPVAWSHYQILLLLPLAIVGQRVCARGVGWISVLGFLALLAALCAPEITFLAPCYMVKNLDDRLDCVLKFPTWAVAGLWLWMASLHLPSTHPHIRQRPADYPEAGHTVPTMA